MSNQMNQIELELEILAMYDEIIAIHYQLRVITADAFADRADFHKFIARGGGRLRELNEAIAVMTAK